MGAEMVGSATASLGLTGLGPAGFGLLILFPFLMAYAAASDLLTMLIPNRISLGLVAGFALLAPTGQRTGVAADHVLAAATALWLGFDGLGDYLLVASLFGGALTLGILFARTHPLPVRIARMPFALHLHDAKTGIPYGIALAAAALLVLPDTDVWTRALAG